ncbi:hypothetical protein BgAZ_208730 [Babesia gibsoni]|uniref:Core Histone H2A/H2B/H3 domain-containing protein n=1 Tax=Babesia gibsoni TaxID=33632 RepID=A0AAD8UT40_BABGI|nr:hypothetical protein BgAZ_208730 [Babesia gibsoni]
MDYIEIDDSYSITDDDSPSKDGTPGSRIPVPGNPDDSFADDDIVNIPSSRGTPAGDLGNQEDAEYPSFQGIPTTVSAKSSSDRSAAKEPEEVRSASRVSVPEVASASRASASLRSGSSRGGSARSVERSEDSLAFRASRASIASANSALLQAANSPVDDTTISANARVSSATTNTEITRVSSAPSTGRSAPEPESTEHVTTQRTSEIPPPKPKGAAPMKRPPIKPVAVLSPARIIAEFKRGSMNKQQAVESLIRYRMNKMLHKNSDRMYVDKDGDVRFVKGYDFGKSRDTRGRAIKRNGFTRIEREILAYQKSTHLLIPRSIFARIVREIAQSWWTGPEPVKFTVEALSALQAATEDEITRILEISTACSYHAKRITLRIDDMRLARFCRGRQEYEFFNIKN